MEQFMEAVYENDALRPLTLLRLSEGQKVQLTVQSIDELEPGDMLQLAAAVYEGLSEEEINDIELIALAR